MKIIRAGFNVPRHIFLNLAQITTCYFTCICCSVQISNRVPPAAHSCLGLRTHLFPTTWHSLSITGAGRKPRISSPPKYFTLGFSSIAAFCQHVKSGEENTWCLGKKQSVAQLPKNIIEMTLMET